MATRITDRAIKVAEGIIRQNEVPYTVWADFQVGQRVQADQPNRYWLVLKTKARTITTSTQQAAVYRDWLDLIAENGTPT